LYEYVIREAFIQIQDCAFRQLFGGLARRRAHGACRARDDNKRRRRGD
jgi:hypothetical protein